MVLFKISRDMLNDIPLRLIGILHVAMTMISKCVTIITKISDMASIVARINKKSPQILIIMNI